MTSSEWEPVADRVAAAFPKADFGPERRAEYLHALEALPADGVSRAVNALLREPRADPPSAPVIRQAVLRAARPARPSARPDPALVIQRARIYGLSFVSSALSAVVLVVLAVWWLWWRG